jgi:hypothetical protein
MEFLSKLYDEWKRTHPRTYGSEMTTQEEFCKKFHVAADTLRDYLAINSSPPAKQLLKGGESKEKVIQTMISDAASEMLTDKKERERQMEDISKKIIGTAEVFSRRTPKTAAGLAARKRLAKALGTSVDDVSEVAAAVRKYPRERRSSKNWWTQKSRDGA